MVVAKKKKKKKKSKNSKKNKNDRSNSTLTGLLGNKIDPYNVKYEMGSRINDIMIRSSSVGRLRKSANSSFSETRSVTSIKSGVSMRSVNSDFNKSFSNTRI